MKKLTLTEHPIRFGCGAALNSSYGTCIATNSHITDLLSSNVSVDVVIYWFDQQSFIYLLYTHQNYITIQFFYNINIYINLYIV